MKTVDVFGAFPPEWPHDPMMEIHDLIGASRRKLVANGGITSIGIGVRRARVLGKLICDAYRGLIMVALAFNGFGLAAMAWNHLRAEPDSEWWKVVYHPLEHVEWVGCGFWDLIQPSFMFMVGVSMAYSYANRRRPGYGLRRRASSITARA